MSKKHGVDQKVAADQRGHGIGVSLQFYTSSDIEQKREAVRKLDDTVRRSEPIPWSADYFKYRILGERSAPFTFGEVMQKAESVFDELPPYEEIKDMILELLGQGGGPAVLRQRFEQVDEKSKEVSGSKEIVFGPAA